MNAAQISRAALRMSAVVAVIGPSLIPGVHAQGTDPKPAAKKQAARQIGAGTSGTRKPQDPQSALFLTPGGLYTEADIKANGRKTVAQKYPNFMAQHDPKPKAGDRVCPVTDTKANPKLTWVVGGKTYQFCCPPCVAEFVAKAKKEPDSIKAPGSYVKKR